MNSRYQILVLRYFTFAIYFSTKKASLTILLKIRFALPRTFSIFSSNILHFYSLSNSNRWDLSKLSITLYFPTETLLFIFFFNFLFTVSPFFLFRTDAVVNWEYSTGAGAPEWSFSSTFWINKENHLAVCPVLVSIIITTLR